MKSYSQLADINIGDQYPVRLMGIINVSPESFFKDSVSAAKDDIKRTAEQMTIEGADILDIGARSTAPYLKTDISIEEEIERLTSAIETIKSVTDKPISADTQIAKVAQAAREAGAAILNDVSGLAHDPDMANIAKTYDGTILMANGNYTDVEGDPISVVTSSLKTALQKAEQAGIPAEKIVLDPGIGFFRNQKISWEQWDRALLQHLKEFYSLGRPLLLGVSRKSFIGKVLGHTNPKDRLYGSLGVTAIAVYNGAHIIRTHDIASTRDIIRIAEWLQKN